MSSKRKDHRSFLLGPSVTPYNSDINGLKLPSKSQVIRSFIAIKEEIEGDPINQGKKLLRLAANRVVEKVLVFYVKARIPTVENNKMSEKILTYYNTMQVF